MIAIILIAFFSLIGLIILHELGHFIMAKKFGVKVEEFGVGYPPRLFGKKIGETIYSLNLLPFGAFVKIYGQEKMVKSARSFSEKPFLQKSLIILGGVVSFWLIAVILLSILMILGVPTVVNDDENNNLINPRVQIGAVADGSPAEQAGLKIGDTVTKFQISNFKFQIDKVKELQEFTERYKGEKVILTIESGREVFDVSLVPRISPPENEGPIGVILVRTALRSHPWYLAPFKGIKATADLTFLIVKGWGITLISLFQGRGVPPGVELKGVVGIFDLFVRAGGLGASYFLQLVAIISISLALINVLPIPALDGGWFLFLLIEKLRGKSLNQKIVQDISLAFFLLLIALMILITIKDIKSILV